jgi:hypothetical protein
LGLLFAAALALPGCGCGGNGEGYPGRSCGYGAANPDDAGSLADDIRYYLVDNAYTCNYYGSAVPSYRNSIVVPAGDPTRAYLNGDLCGNGADPATDIAADLRYAVKRQFVGYQGDTYSKSTVGLVDGTATEVLAWCYTPAVSETNGMELFVFKSGTTGDKYSEVQEFSTDPLVTSTLYVTEAENATHRTFTATGIVPYELSLTLSGSTPAYLHDGELDYGTLANQAMTCRIK